MENVAFFFHIIGVMLFVAGVVVAGVVFEAGGGDGRLRSRCSSYW